MGIDSFMSIYAKPKKLFNKNPYENFSIIFWFLCWPYKFTRYEITISFR